MIYKSPTTAINRARILANQHKITFYVWQRIGLLQYCVAPAKPTEPSHWRSLYVID